MSLRALACVLSLAFASLARADELYESQEWGYEVLVPADWTQREQDLPNGGALLMLLPPGSVGRTAFALTAKELGEGEDRESLMEAARERIRDSGGALRLLGELEGELAGLSARGLEMELDSAGTQVRLEAWFLVREGRAYAVQLSAEAAEWESQRAAFAAVMESFELRGASAEGAEARRLTSLAARAGSQLSWADSWEAAVARAEAEGKWVLVVAHVYGGFDLPSNPRTTIFSEPDVVELVEARYVPLEMGRAELGSFAERYGLGPFTFGQGLIVCDLEGEVIEQCSVATHPDVAYEFLRLAGRAIADYEELHLLSESEALELARALRREGDLSNALAALRDRRSGAAALERARVLRLQRKGERALAALEQARQAGDVDGRELMLERLRLGLRSGAEREIERSLDALLEDAQGEALAESRMAQGLLHLMRDERPEALAAWTELTLEHPDSPFAWQAASLLRSPLLDMGLPFDLDWPTNEELHSAAGFGSHGLGAARSSASVSAPEALESALQWLLLLQREGGDWVTPTLLTHSEEQGPEPLHDAICALALRSLMGHLERDGAEEAVLRGLESLRGSVELRREHPPVVLYMDYMTWSDAMMLATFAEAVERGLWERASAQPVIQALLEDLAGRQVGTDGWSYYVSSDLENAAAAQSISFTTAACVLALERVRRAGFELPEGLLEQSADALLRMRNEDGVFSYFLYAGSGAIDEATAARGATGRGPACELALLRAGLGSEERLREALERFVADSPLYAAERGKVMMHAGPEGQGCHYLFFDYAHAALAAQELGASAEVRARLTELVLDCRLLDGAFQDTPILGRAYGTAMASLALDALAADAD